MTLSPMSPRHDAGGQFASLNSKAITRAAA